jgi:circadian clock protein KaiB
VYELVLYISGATEHSRLALSNIRSLGEKHLEGRYRLAVVDLFQDPGQARTHDVLALPMLVKKLPLPIRRMIGDLSNEERVLIGLDLAMPDESNPGDK